MKIVKSSFVLHSIYSHLNLIQQKKIILFLKGKEVYARKILFAYIYIYIYIYIYKGIIQILWSRKRINECVHGKVRNCITK